MIEVEEGYYRDLSNNFYHSGSNGSSSSFLKLFHEYATPAHVKYHKQNPAKPTKPMRLGTAVHSLVLEPDNFYNDNILVASEYPKAIKEAMEASPDKNVISKQQYEFANRMADKVKAHPFIKNLLADSWSETSVWQQYETVHSETGEPISELIKCRIDCLPMNYPFVVDLKTAADASPNGFLKSCYEFEYYLSAAMYRWIANNCDDLMSATNFAERPLFVFIVVENKPPFEVAWYQASAEKIGEGFVKFQGSIEKLHDAKKNNWPSFSEECVLL